MITPEPCEKCDFIGPLPERQQPARDVHRAWHEISRGFAPIVEAFRVLAAAAQNATQADYAVPGPLVGIGPDPVSRAAERAYARELRRNGYGPVYDVSEDPRPLDQGTTTTPTGETMTTTTPAPETWRVEVGDDVVVTRKMGRAEGPVTQIDLSATKGTGLRIDGHPMPFWIGPRHDSWTLAEHRPAMPDESELIENGLYEITRTGGDEQARAYWAPIDGIRAGHPWLHPDGKTRYRRGSVIRARLVQREIASVVKALES